MTKKVLVALVGHGHIGKWHAEKIDQHHLADFVAIVEQREHSFENIRKKYPDVLVTTSLEEVIDKAEAFVIATPTNTHFSLLKTLLEKRKHIFCEKPLTSVYKQCLILEELQRKYNTILQVGHSERFHEAWEWNDRYGHLLTSPCLIKTNRCSVFNNRSTDIDVVNDLMTHDLDMIYYFLREIPKTVQAIGYKTKTSKWDHVVVQATFSSGSKAFLTVGRDYIDKVRTFEVFNKNGCFFVDCDRCDVKIIDNTSPSRPTTHYPYHKRDHLLLQHHCFYQSILSKQKKTIAANIKDATIISRTIDSILQSLDTGKNIFL